MTYTVSGAKNRLSELIRHAESGARVTITKRGVAVVENSRPRRVFGVLGQKKIVIDPAWAPSQDHVEAWLAGDV